VTAQTVTKAVAQRDDSAGGVIAKYAGDFARVLPSHIKPDTWVRLTQGALRKGKRIDAENPRHEDHPYHGMFELEVAARNNLGVFLATLLDAARLGLEPGTEHYYLTVRKIKGKREILGIVGYQGIVDLMYRGGAVEAVIAETVRANDRYQYRRGIDLVPIQEYPPFAREADRGPLVGAYAYARMRGGGISKVVEVNADDIARVKAMNPHSGYDSSPWVKWENEQWLKTPTRRLRKWVPTSPEFMRQQAIADAAAREVAEERDLPDPVAEADEVIDGEWIDEDWPETREPGGSS
jgi:recombination protein RecT